MADHNEFIDKMLQAPYDETRQSIYADWIGDKAGDGNLEAIMRRLDDLVRLVAERHLSLRVEKQSTWAGSRELTTGFIVNLTWDGVVIGQSIILEVR